MARMTARRPSQNGKAAAGFGVITLIGLVAYAIGYGIAALIVAIVTGLLAGVFAALQVRDNGGRLARPRTVATTKRERSIPSLPKNYVYRTRKARAARRRAAVAAGHIHSGSTRMAGRSCNSSCQNSRLPRWTCHCVCGGENHGRHAGLLAAPRIVSELVAEVAPTPRPTPARPRGKPRSGGTKKPRRTTRINPPDPNRRKRVAIPAGGPGAQLVVVWRNPADGKPYRTQVPKATAQIMEKEGHLISVEAKVAEDPD